MMNEIAPKKKHNILSSTSEETAASVESMSTGGAPTTMRTHSTVPGYRTTGLAQAAAQPQGHNTTDGRQQQLERTITGTLPVLLMEMHHSRHPARMACCY
jgi:hypothetical protein